MLSRIAVTLSVVSLIAVATLYYATFHSSPKLVYVDSSKLLNEYKGMIDARAAYQKKASSWKANVDTLAAEVQRQIMDYEKNNSKLTANERKLTQDLIRAKQKQLYDYQHALNAQAQDEDQKVTGQVIAQINAYIKKYGESKGYRIIMAATEYGNIAYAHDEINITDEILVGLNSEYMGK
jgi:outer membrane protein